ncbi:hypothetical protein EYC80_002345 [Monilinia laxa]|uniref:Uncharacterized protein n=1 Tax=Monilinia laxa TaxID=61186 RepID=A0A5N6K3N4_MONLA|nr:hypothetical protein EYC80_002345 [Monilinia laxa]
MLLSSNYKTKCSDKAADAEVPKSWMLVTFALICQCLKFQPLEETETKHFTQDETIDASLQEEALETRFGQNVTVSSEKPEVLNTKTGAFSDALENDEDVVDFGENDPENPLNLPLWRKWSIVSCTALMFMLVFSIFVRIRLLLCDSRT